MGSLEVINQKSERIGEVTVDDQLISLQKNQGVIHEAVVIQLSSKRQGTAATKTRGLVRGGGKKPWRQKGTGRARAGSSRSPIWKGGGTVFGPQPKRYAFPFSKKKMKLALASTLGARIAEGKVVVIDGLELPEPKTKFLVQALTAVGLSGKILIIVPGENGGLKKASANLKNVTLLKVEEINVYDLVRAEHVLVLKEAFEPLMGAWV